MTPVQANQVPKKKNKIKKCWLSILEMEWTEVQIKCRMETKKFKSMCIKTYLYMWNIFSFKPFHKHLDEYFPSYNILTTFFFL